MNEYEEPPLLFLDVDGPLLPFSAGVRPAHQRPAAVGHSAPQRPAAVGHLARLRPSVGLRLAALPCELVWATTQKH